MAWLATLAAPSKEVLTEGNRSEDDYGGLDAASSSSFSLAYLQIVWNRVKLWEIV